MVGAGTCIIQFRIPMFPFGDGEQVGAIHIDAQVLDTKLFYLSNRKGVTKLSTLQAYKVGPL